LVVGLVGCAPRRAAAGRAPRRAFSRGAIGACVTVDLGPAWPRLLGITAHWLEFGRLTALFPDAESSGRFLDRGLLDGLLHGALLPKARKELVEATLAVDKDADGDKDRQDAQDQDDDEGNEETARRTFIVVVIVVVRVVIVIVMHTTHTSQQPGAGPESFLSRW